MKAVVVAAGEGRRLWPLTATRPKPLVPVAGRPVLEHVLEAAAPVVDGYVVVVGYRGEDVREHVGEEHAGLPVEYVRQDEQLGTAHAVGRAADAVEERFLVLNGDCLLTTGLLERLAAAGGTAMAATSVEDPTSYGVLETEGDRVTGLVEKPADPPSSLANVGAYAFDPQVFEYVERTDRSERGEYEITTTIEIMLADGHEVAHVEHEGRWLDVGRPWDVLTATESLLAERERRIAGEVADDAVLEGTVVVEEGARIRPGAVLEGPVLVRSGAEVGPNAYVRGATAIGPDASVGHAVEVKNSVLFAGAAANHLSYVGDSVLGADVNLGAGTVVANLRHDDENVRMTVKGERVDTGRRKLGVVLGDGAKTGIDTAINAGVILGPGATTGPGETVTRDRGERE